MERPGQIVAAMLGLMLSLVATPALAFDNVSQGFTVDSSVGTSGVGDFIVGDIAGETTGLTSFSADRYLLQWDGSFGPSGGVLAASLPYTKLLGGHTRLWAEGGLRLSPERENSVYFGIRSGLDIEILLPTQNGLGGLSRVNNIGGIGDFGLIGRVRGAGGWSLLREHHELLITAFVEELGRGAETNEPGEGFTNAGLAARFDLERSVTLTAEGSWGRALSMSDSALGNTEYHSLFAANFLVRKVFPNGMWLSLVGSITAEKESTTYARGPTYRTADAPTQSATIAYGFPIDAQAFP